MCGRQAERAQCKCYIRPLQTHPPPPGWIVPVACSLLDQRKLETARLDPTAQASEWKKRERTIPFSNSLASSTCELQDFSLRCASASVGPEPRSKDTCPSSPRRRPSMSRALSLVSPCAKQMANCLWCHGLSSAIELACLSHMLQTLVTHGKELSSTQSDNWPRGSRWNEVTHWSRKSQWCQDRNDRLTCWEGAKGSEARGGGSTRSDADGDQWC